MGSGGGDHELVAQHQELQILGGVTAGEQHEQLDRPAQREVGELRPRQDGLPSQGSGVPPYRAVDANWQLIGHVRLYAPFKINDQTTSTSNERTAPDGAP